MKGLCQSFRVITNCVSYTRNGPSIPSTLWQILSRARVPLFVSEMRKMLKATGKTKSCLSEYGMVKQVPFIAKFYTDSELNTKCINILTKQGAKI